MKPSVYVLYAVYFVSEEVFSIPVALVILFYVQLSWEPWFINLHNGDL